MQQSPEDTINVTAIDANGAVAGDLPFLWGGTAATANGGWYSVSGGNSTVYFDTDGNAQTAEMVIYLEGVISLTAGADFLL